MRGLSGKVAIVTGAASPQGIGFASAGRLAEEGAKLVLTDLDADRVAERARDLRFDGHDVIGMGHNALDEQGWDDVLRVTKDRFGQLDILVNNAGIISLSHIVDMNFADWRHVLDANGGMAFLGCRMAAREMKASGRGGAIINVASTASIVAGEYAAAYCASKSAVQMLTRVLALEEAKHGVRVNSVHPGYTLTEMLSSGVEDPSVELEQMARVPAARLANPSEIAAAIAFLASDDASYCNGASLVVDGGLTV